MCIRDRIRSAFGRHPRPRAGNASLAHGPEPPQSRAVGGSGLREGGRWRCLASVGASSSTAMVQGVPSAR
eukprot:5069409-Alexandrium_andersonii.AAC.1